MSLVGGRALWVLGVTAKGPGPGVPDVSSTFFYCGSRALVVVVTSVG